MRHVTTNTADRRKSMRVRLNSGVVVKHGPHEFSSVAADISDDSLRITGAPELATGSTVVVTLTDDLGDQLAFAGKVSRLEVTSTPGSAELLVTRV